MATKDPGPPPATPYFPDVHNRVYPPDVEEKNRKAFMLEFQGKRKEADKAHAELQGAIAERAKRGIADSGLNKRTAKLPLVRSHVPGPSHSKGGKTRRSKSSRGKTMATRKHRRRGRRGGGLLSTGLGALKNLKAEDLKSAVTSAAKNLKPEDLKSAVSTGKDLLAQQQAQPVAEEKPIDTAGVQNLVNAVGAQFKESSDSDSGKITITFDRDDILRLIEKRGGRKTRRKRKSRKSA